MGRCSAWWRSSWSAAGRLRSGFALSVVMLLVTMAANVPLNDALAAGEVTRSGFEGSWNTWNVVRAVAGTGSLVAFSWALLTR
ncbi:DUF1772 domain-containing protein [Streptosporangium sp. NPDC049644]|uniref:DUF1772 domain-containing protein n=1 Tax=Streptosporangium sp. NPDC049644 TaxID=3155507 RepID=UPI00343370C2